MDVRGVVVKPEVDVTSTTQKGSNDVMITGLECVKAGLLLTVCLTGAPLFAVELQILKLFCVSKAPSGTNTQSLASLLDCLSVSLARASVSVEGRQSSGF